MSVRKLHLIGRNHLRFYCDYYEQRAKQQGLWNDNVDSEVLVSSLSQNAPAPPSYPRETESCKQDLPSILPPPPHLLGLPLPPTAFTNLTHFYESQGHTVTK